MSAGAFRIAYIGGGSRFVVTLLHGLAGARERLAGPGRAIELALCDPDLSKARRMAEYAGIVRRETGLGVSVETTADAQRAVDGADWVIFAPGLYRAYRPLRERLLGLGVEVAEDSGPGCALEASLAWPLLLDLGKTMRRLAPKAFFTTLVNPTDVLAPAFEQTFGFPSVGVCVEAPQLRRWLAYHLKCRADQIELDHLGLNHCGWVSRVMLDGEDARARILAALEKRQATEWFDPQNDFFVEVLRETGLMRTSAYHPWPFVRRSSPDAEARKARFQKAVAAEHGRAMHERLETALSSGRMIAEDDDRPVARWLHPYAYCTTRHTLAALAVGLTGEDAGPVPLQVRNGESNHGLPPDAWIEVPTRVSRGSCHPQTAAPPPGWTLPMLSAIATQRATLARWLVTGEQGLLAEALLACPEPISLERVWRLKQLSALAKGTPSQDA